MKTIKNTQISLTLPESMKEEVARISIKRDMSQQKVYRMMLDLGIECHKDMERVGIIAAVDFAYFVKKALKEKLRETGAVQTEIT